MGTPICFVDTETISLQRDHRHIWEVGLIVPDHWSRKEWSWTLDAPLGEADSKALEIGQFHERFSPPGADRAKFAREFSQLTWGKHIVGAVPSFDEERLWHLLRANNACPGWHYHVIDIEAIIVGYLAAQARIDGRSELLEIATPPYNSNELSKAIGVDPEKFDRHTALGDCRWTKALWDEIF